MLLAGLLFVVSVASTPAVSTAAPAVQSAPTSQARLDEAAAFARDLSRLEADRNWRGLAARMHPDSRAVVPPDVVAGWYEATFDGKTTSELSVTAVEPVQWTWPVTGEVYDAVRVSFVQPYWVDGVRADEPGVVHLVETTAGAGAGTSGWGWFFGGSRPFVDEQLQRYAPTTAAAPAAPAPAELPAIGGVIDNSAAYDPARAALFPDPLHAHVDAFWAAQFAAAGLEYQPPGGVIAFDEPTPTGCGIADPATETAFYCVLDATIYYSTEFRDVLEDNIGDFAWVVVVAHEWGHHVQLLLGYDAGVLSWRVGETPSVAMEQQADCLAGAYTDGAEFSGWLDPGDVDEGLLVTGLSGDPPGASALDPEAHGSGPERVAAFTAGYAEGVAACGLEDVFDGG
jgi:hypothetical protein